MQAARRPSLRALNSGAGCGGMRIVIQRVSRASVSVAGETVGEIGRGALILVGVADGDDESRADALASKAAGLRILAGTDGKPDLSLAGSGGAALVVSQFTLQADVRKGRRPSFTGAAAPELAEPLVERFASALEAEGIAVERGRFGAYMQVDLVNDGPFTIVIDSADLERSRKG